MALSSTIQDMKADAVRRVIFEAVADELAATGTDFTVQGVADRAGISYRTVYRYFPSRDDLLGQFVAWLEDTLDHRRIHTADEIAPVLRHNFRRLEAYADVIVPMMKICIATGLNNEHSADRSEQMVSALKEEVGHLPPDVGMAVAWTIRELGSYRTWMRLRDEAGISGDCSGAAAAWAVDTLLRALRNGEGPRAGCHEEQP